MLDPTIMKIVFMSAYKGEKKNQDLVLQLGLSISQNSSGPTNSLHFGLGELCCPDVRTYR